MSDPPPLGTGVCLDFNAPLSAARADRLATDLAGRGPATVVDLGCGWGELLLRVLAAAGDATGVGIDTHGPDLVRARANAETRGLSDRVTFVEGAAADHAVGADLVINSGAYHAFGERPTPCACCVSSSNRAHGCCSAPSSGNSRRHPSASRTCGRA
jgi:hypothetical protein